MANAKAAPGNIAAEGAGAKSSNKKFIIIGIVLALAAGGGWYLTQGKAATGAEAAAGEHGEAPAGEHGEAAGGGSSAQYLTLDPPLIVNISQNSKARYLQVSLDVMATETAAIEAVKKHMPAIRNNLVLLLSNQQYDMLTTMEGKESLRTQILEQIKSTIAANGETAEVESVYYTGFIIQ
jgi:flagellar FliL protein